MNNQARHIIILLLIICTLSARGVTAVPAGQDDDDNQAALRESAVTIENPAVAEHLSSYPFLNLSANRIHLNGDDWGTLADKIRNCDSTKFSIVHIGDSHIQADVMTGTVRNNLQNKFGNGGRGLIVPLKIAGTNQPSSYSFTINQPAMTAKLLSVPWLSDMRFTGASFTPRTMKYSISLSASDSSPFDKIRLYTRGRFFIDRITDNNGTRLLPVVLPSTRYVDLILPVSVSEVKIDMHSFEEVSFSGAELIHGISGLLYHAIGNNGACFSNYNRIDCFGQDIATLDPDLIIISLGTNDAFGRISEDSFEAEMDYLIRNLRKASPAAKILLITPMECQKTVRSYTRSRKGRRRRYSSSKSYQVNTRVADLAAVIREYGRKNNIPVYDLYEVAGGKGASSRWANAKLMSTDRIHLSFPGYRIAGDLFSEALCNSFNLYINPNLTNHSTTSIHNK